MADQFFGLGPEEAAQAKAMIGSASGSTLVMYMRRQKTAAATFGIWSGSFFLGSTFWPVVNEALGWGESRSGILTAFIGLGLAKALLRTAEGFDFTTLLPGRRKDEK